ncbi:MAG TPA: DUF1080 domain-containing protein [Bryobacteraceae bacterium]|nr:DUF1080 domain-containing protein [Bryobacteraceae bacterium]
MTRRTLLASSIVAASIPRRVIAEEVRFYVDDGNSHGDPPFLLERGWTPLLNGRDLSGWAYERPHKAGWTTSPGIYWDGQGAPKELASLPGPGSRIANGPHGGNSNIYTRQTFGDVELYLEFLIPARSNSGVYLHGLYEVQIYDSFGVQHPTYIDCGAIYERWINDKGVGGWPPLVNAALPPGQWQSFQIWFKAPRFNAGRKVADATFVRVLHNGILVQKNTEVDGPTRSGLDRAEAAENPLMLQGDHGPVAYRNMYIRPLRPVPEQQNS